MSLPLNVIQKKAECSDEERQNIWMTSITDRYKRRPKTEEFAKMCLATFASEYRILSKSEGSSTNSIKLDKGLGFVKKRTRTDAAVILYARFSPTKDPEKYYQSILQLFLPHYLESQLKPSYFNTYQEFYETGYVKFCDELCSVKLIVDSNRAMFEKEADIIDQAQEDLEMHGPMEDAWAEICPESEGERLECLASRSDQTTDMDEHSDVIPDLLPKSTCTWQDNPHCMPKQQAMILIRALNEKQSEIFYKIRQWCLQKTRGENPEPFQVFISGPGGVGKSMLIKALHYEAYRILSHLSDNPDEIHVLLTAPTGVSAYNIDAATIHTCLSIGKDIKLPYQPLGDDKINSLRSKLGNLQILIIDEISMVDHKLLAYVHGRLRQIKQAGDYSPFGKVSIIAVGDFYQLGPVKGKPLYIEPPGVNLWQNHFALAELTDIMRQKDAEFAQLLNRLRKRKKGEVLPEQDINMLKQKHGHHATVHNTCLTQALHIGVNARVMLLKNIDVSDGLVNGAFGTVNEVSGKALRAKHPGLKPGLTKATSIQPEEERVTNNGGIRRQFPLKFYKPVIETAPSQSSYKILLHNVQGLTCHIEDIRHMTGGTWWLI
uniref:ATP-dependent DNA helicase n=1 Tax=Pygocentrus nattereri TaxID=42514 RepID=A0AAR2JX05_PYGNA